jgi:hypothetical protein
VAEVVGKSVKQRRIRIVVMNLIVIWLVSLELILAAKAAKLFFVVDWL